GKGNNRGGTGSLWDIIVLSNAGRTGGNWSSGSGSSWGGGGSFGGGFGGGGFGGGGASGSW
ncbi:MAG: TPM domain-containing protein, partial [Flavobacterium sp.]